MLNKTTYVWFAVLCMLLPTCALAKDSSNLSMSFVNFTNNVGGNGYKLTFQKNRYTQSASQCTKGCQIVRDQCIGVGNNRSECNDDYRVCMNSC